MITTYNCLAVIPFVFFVFFLILFLFLACLITRRQNKVFVVAERKM